MAKSEDTQTIRRELLRSSRVCAASLVVVNSKGGESKHRMDGQHLRVGSHPGNDLVLDDDAVSRSHFELVADQTGVRIRDLNSTNGTFVGDFRVMDAMLPHRCEVRVGRTILRVERLPDELEVPLALYAQFGGLIGRSAPMRALFAKMESVCATDATVLIQGESGTGKELIAEAIHEASTRKGGPFIVFDCSSVAPNLIESELFGHEKGAFTGAIERRVGCVEQADGGTLFLDEIGELPLELQPKLLRAIEKRSFRSLGTSRTHNVDIRIIAATNRDLASEINSGAFRDDLYYRLAVVRLRAPPLRHRKEDVRLLVEHFVRERLQRAPDRAEAILRAMSDENWTRLEDYPWRGNVRELRNAVERSLALGVRLAQVTIRPGSSASDTIPPAGGSPTKPNEDQDPSHEILSFPWTLANELVPQRQRLVCLFEDAYLKRVLQANGGNFSKAAEQAGLDRMYFKRLLKKYP
jgi:DNA-binding NtrC family response regulator